MRVVLSSSSHCYLFFIEITRVWSGVGFENLFIVREWMSRFSQTGESEARKCGLAASRAETVSNRWSVWYWTHESAGKIKDDRRIPRRLSPTSPYTPHSAPQSLRRSSNVSSETTRWTSSTSTSRHFLSPPLTQKKTTASNLTLLLEWKRARFRPCSYLIRYNPNWDPNAKKERWHRISGDAFYFYHYTNCVIYVYNICVCTQCINNF